MCPGHGTGGRKPTNAALKQLAGHGDPGMFGRMFAHLPPLDVPDSKLQALAAAMLDPNTDDGTLGNDNIPAGFTYLGQFVDHDITLDLTSLSDQTGDPPGLETFPTPPPDRDTTHRLDPTDTP